MEPKKAVSGMALRRMAVLEKGEFKDELDCVMISFLVGSYKTIAEEIRACKFDLMVASEYFQGLLRSPLTPPGPIRIKHVEPEIFKLVVEFTHLSGQLVSEVTDLEQCLKLAAAADEFLLEELGKLCTEKLEKFINVDNVWIVFNQNHFIKYTSVVCEKLLSSKTEECLKQQAFLKISGKTLAIFLKMKMMSIKSEMELVRACLKFVKGKENERALFRRRALPHLRLLTLSADDLAELAPFLEKDEKMFLSFNLLEKDPLLMKDEFSDATSLCKILEPRVLTAAALEQREQKIVDFLPYNGPGNSYRLTSRNNKYSLEVKAHTSIRITGFDIMYQKGQIDEQSYGWIDSTRVRFITRTRRERDGPYLLEMMNLKPNQHCDYYSHFETSIYLHQGGRAQVEVEFDKICYFKCALAKEVCDNPDLYCSTFQILSANNIFKCLYYENVPSAF